MTLAYFYPTHVISIVHHWGRFFFNFLAQRLSANSTAILIADDRLYLNGGSSSASRFLTLTSSYIWLTNERLIVFCSFEWIMDIVMTDYDRWAEANDWNVMITNDWDPLDRLQKVKLLVRQLVSSYRWLVLSWFLLYSLLPVCICEKVISLNKWNRRKQFCQCDVWFSRQ
jgi:hypothetical protein